MDPIKQVEERNIISISLGNFVLYREKVLFLEESEEGAIEIFAIELKLTALRWWWLNKTKFPVKWKNNSFKSRKAKSISKFQTWHFSLLLYVHFNKSKCTFLTLKFSFMLFVSASLFLWRSRHRVSEYTASSPSFEVEIHRLREGFRNISSVN